MTVFNIDVSSNYAQQQQCPRRAERFRAGPAAGASGAAAARGRLRQHARSRRLRPAAAPAAAAGRHPAAAHGHRLQQPGSRRLQPAPVAWPAVASRGRPQLPQHVPEPEAVEEPLEQRTLAVISIGNMDAKTYDALFSLLERIEPNNRYKLIDLMYTLISTYFSFKKKIS